MTARGTLAIFLSFAASAAAQDAPVDVFSRLRVDPGGWSAERVARVARTEAPEVRIADAESEEARAAIGLARASLMPRLVVGAAYSRLNELDLPPFELGGSTVENPFPQILNRYALSADLIVPLSSLADGTPGLRAARNASEAARWDAQTTHRRAIMTALLVFYEHLRARGSEIVAEDGVRLLTSVVGDLARLNQAGALPRTDLLEARAELASARVGAASAGAAVRATRARLRAILNVRSSDELELGEDLLSGLPPAPNVDEVIDRGLASRVELRSLHRARAAADDEVRVRRRQQIPRVDLTASVLYARPNPRVVPQTSRFDGSWEVGVAVTWAPNSLAVARHQMSAARARRARLTASLEQVEDAIRVAAAHAVHRYEAALLAIDAAEDGMEAASAAFEARRRLLTAGAATTRQLLDAEVQLRRAQIQLVDAHIRARLARLAIAEAAGDELPP